MKFGMRRLDAAFARGRTRGHGLASPICHPFAKPQACPESVPNASEEPLCHPDERNFLLSLVGSRFRGSKLQRESPHPSATRGNPSRHYHDAQDDKNDQNPSGSRVPIKIIDAEGSSQTKGRSPPKPLGASPRRGFSLLEVAAALLLFAIVAALAIPSLRSVTGADLRASVSQLQGVVQDVYNRAALSDRVHRLVIDLDKQQYWVESTKEQWLLPKERQDPLEAARRFARQLGGGNGGPSAGNQQNKFGEKRNRAKREENAPRSAAASVVTKMVGQIGELFGGGSSGSAQEDGSGERGRTRFTPIADQLGQKTQLRPPVRIQKVWADHLSNWVETGSVGITFFPGGYTQEAFLVLGVEKRQLALMIEPLTGESAVRDKEPEIPD
ncbi:MAG: prepilin-type N-terminal cleavage/methylation domain-containing protein [Myxococcota bacterium]